MFWFEFDWTIRRRHCAMSDANSLASFPCRTRVLQISSDGVHASSYIWNVVFNKLLTFLLTYESVVSKESRGRGRKLLFTKRQLQISNREDYGCTKVQFCPHVSTKWEFLDTNFIYLEENFLTHKNYEGERGANCPCPTLPWRPPTKPCMQIRGITSNCSFFMRESSYFFQRVLATAILSVRLSVCHTGGSVKNGAR